MRFTIRSIASFFALRSSILALALSLALAPASLAAEPSPAADSTSSEPTPSEPASSEPVDTTEPTAPATDPLSAEEERWLREVDPLITAKEKSLFTRLTRRHQRDAFRREFWKVRDPYPRTVRNELKERWPVRVAEARNLYGSLTDDRARMLLAQGPPAATFEVRCTGTYRPVTVWVYRGTDWTRVNAALIFYRERRAGRIEEARLWRPGYSGPNADRVIRSAQNCIGGPQMMDVFRYVTGNLQDYERDLEILLAKPRPSSTEWVESFVALSTDRPADAETLEGTIDFAFPGRHQLRTLAQVLVSFDRDAVEAAEYAGYRSYDFRLVGEVIKDGTLFESFRYQFGFPAEEAPETIPLSFQRLLRPGDYRLVVRVDDLNSDKVFRVEREIDVPSLENQVEMPTFQDPETESLFAEATAALAAGETGLRLIPPQGELQTGFTRFDAIVSGDEVEKVRFVLDEQPILTKNRPPFQVSIDLGPYPDLHSLRAEGLDADGEIVVEDSILLNSGGYRFVVKLREPRPGKRYEKSLQARLDVEVPEGRSLERVELFLNETRVATLYQEPFVHPIVLPKGEAVGYVRAVAYLPDGNSTEDIVFINAPGEVEEVEVQFVELYTSVLDAAGSPIVNLARDEITVLEDGVEQSIRRFEKVEDLPIHVGIVLDTSASMVGVLDDVRRAALSFLDQAITPKDRAAIITFNTFPDLKVPLTNDARALGAGLAGIAPEGRTALYDSVMFGLYYFTGVKGQRALLVLSDGKDESSRFDFDQTLEYARRAGITLYTIGLRLGDPSARAKLRRLAEETGGASFLLRDIDQLGPVYARIQEELRSQLLIAYQSSNTSEDGEFRRVEVEVDRPDVTVRTLAGYYP